MNLEATKNEDEYKVWMTDDEIETLRRHVDSHRDDIIIQLGNRCGLRAFEIQQISPYHIRRTSDGDHHRLRVPAGKDTSGENDGKPRNAYLPAEVEADLHRYITAESIGDDEPVVPMSTRGVRAAVKRVAERAAEETGTDDFRHVSSHDLRRQFAQRLLVERQISPEVVMAVGGWSSYKAIVPYLETPTEEVINEAFEEAGLA